MVSGRGLEPQSPASKTEVTITTLQAHPQGGYSGLLVGGGGGVRMRPNFETQKESRHAKDNPKKVQIF